MPGKYESDSSWSFMSTPKLLRSVSAADDPGGDWQAFVAALGPTINLGINEATSGFIAVGREAALILGVLFPVTVNSVTVKVYSFLGDVGSTPNAWALVGEHTVSESAHIRIDGLFPGLTKVVVSAVSGSLGTGGMVSITYSRSM